MTTIPLSDLFTIIFILVNNWYQAKGHQFVKDKRSIKPVFTNSEAIKLMLAQDFVPYPSETRHVAFLRANCLDLFRKLVDQSQFQLAV